MKDLDNNNHSVFLMHYHLILVVKYRRKVIDDDISHSLKEIFERIQPNYNITLQEWKEYFWSRSFCLLTTGGAPLEVIKKYIEQQGGKKIE